MKFKYYINDLNAGDVKGTDDLTVAQQFADNEDCFVVDAEAGHWLLPTGDGSVDIQNADKSF